MYGGKCLQQKVWQNADGIFLGQGKYAVEILKRFGMMDCMTVATPMASNLKLLSVASRGTVDYGLKYDANQKINLEGYVDSYWAGSAIDKKSTSGCCFSMGSGMISWFSRKQSCVALSTGEAEYVAACSASCEAVWLRKLLSDIF